MEIFETYSKRQNGLPDVFVYDDISSKLKTQIFHIWNDYFNQHCFASSGIAAQVQKVIFETICKEEGKKSLYTDGFFGEHGAGYQVEHYFDQLSDADKIIDAIDIVFHFLGRMEHVVRERDQYIQISYPIAKAIENLNQRFRENGVGYEFINGKIIRVDNKLLHKETVQPALSLLDETDYKNANDEYLNAHEHFRFRRNKECLNECLKSFESTIKIICQKNTWSFTDKDTAKPLINILLRNAFLPNYHETQLHAIGQLLESSIPTIRNKKSGHGQGIKTIIVPDSLAQYMLYITGATIRLFVETQMDREKGLY